MSSLFPRPSQPNAGVFIRERMFRVAKHLPLVVVAPVPWFPLQSWIRKWRPGFRPQTEYHFEDQGIDVYCPRFFSVPRLFKSLDGLFMALGSYATCRRLQREGRADVIDAHFVYPDGYAASWLAKLLHVPFTVTARGSEARLVREPAVRAKMSRVVRTATHLFSVSSSLARVLLSLGAPESKLTVVGNATDLDVFHPVDKVVARRELGLPLDVPVLITVGGLVERKGFHRVMDVLPELRKRFPDVVYLVVGGPSPEGDWGPRLREQCRRLGLEDHVRFLGALPSRDLKVPLSAADVFVLATRNEGWANVFLEAMACGLPVVTTDVGGNREVVREGAVGIVVPFGDRSVLLYALEEALAREWDHSAIVAFAESHDWESRVAVLVNRLETTVRERSGP